MEPSIFDLNQFVHRQQLWSYEQDTARASYAYGVDLRRGRGFAASTLIQTAIRPFELQWQRLTRSLMNDELRYVNTNSALLYDILAICKLFHMKVPSIRALTASSQQKGDWGIVTPIGDSHQSDDWLILDLDRLAAENPQVRRFYLGMSLAHLQCQHGVLFMMHFLMHRRKRKNYLLHRLLTPWAKLAVFSADRAGLLAAGDLPIAQQALSRIPEMTPEWFPYRNRLNVRKQALEDFAKSRVAARVHSQQERAKQSEFGCEWAFLSDQPSESVNFHFSDASPIAGAGHEVPLEAWPLARCDQRLTRKLGLF